MQAAGTPAGVWPLGVVVDAPALDDDFGLPQAVEEGAAAYLLTWAIVVGPF